MSFAESIKTCYRKILTFSGRASKKEFWWFVLYTMILDFVVFQMIFGSIAVYFLMTETDGSSTLLLIYGIFALVIILRAIFIFLPLLSVQVRRFHDIGKSAWWIVAANIYGFVAYFIVFSFLDTTFEKPVALAFSLPGLIILITLITFYIKPSQKGPNQYGEEPI